MLSKLPLAKYHQSHSKSYKIYLAQQFIIQLVSIYYGSPFSESRALVVGNPDLPNTRKVCKYLHAEILFLEKRPVLRVVVFLSEVI